MKLSDLRCSGLRVFRVRLIISARFRYSKIVQTFWCIVIFHLNRMEADMQGKYEATAQTGVRGGQAAAGPWASANEPGR